MLALLLQVEAQLNPLSVQKKVKKKYTDVVSVFAQAFLRQVISRRGYYSRTKLKGNQ